jgi:hypothetical protein
MDLSYAPWLFAPLFACGWVAVTTILALQAGWFSMMKRFPDRPEVPLAEFKEQSGTLGAGVNFNRVLRLSPCPGGLRVGMMRLFGPFCRDFFVPWEDLSVERKDGWLGRRATLRFGDGRWSRLVVAGDVADALWRAAQGRWPEGAVPPARETPREIAADLFKKFALTCVALWAVFFFVFPLMGAPFLGKDPTFLFGMFVFFPGIIALSFAWEYHKRSRR